MNKFKIFTILVLMLASTISIQAQEKQNDATWEETVDFINKKSDFFYREFNISQFKIIGDNLEIKIQKTNEKLTLCSINLSKLNSVELGEAKIVIELIGDYRKCNRFEASNNMVIAIDDKDILQRTYKAFKHLTYLATEKRKKEREESGDKF